MPAASYTADWFSQVINHPVNRGQFDAVRRSPALAPEVPGFSPAGMCCVLVPTSQIFPPQIDNHLHTDYVYMHRIFQVSLSFKETQYSNKNEHVNNPVYSQLRTINCKKIPIHLKIAVLYAKIKYV